MSCSKLLSVISLVKRMNCQTCVRAVTIEVIIKTALTICMIFLRSHNVDLNELKLVDTSL